MYNARCGGGGKGGVLKMLTNIYTRRQGIQQKKEAMHTRREGVTKEATYCT